jgi:hypothetical protein
VSTVALRSLLEEMEDAMEDLLDEEIERVESERDFLLAVLDGRTGGEGVSIEDVSTELTETYLTTALSVYIPIEEDEDG